MRSKAFLAVFVAVAFATGCSGPSGLLGTERHPSGDIVVSSYPGNVPLTTSASKPYSVSSAFSISVSEAAFSGPYTVTMYSWNNNFNVPCFEPHAKSATIYEFTPDHEALPGAAENPCETGDVETALINDGKGHDLYFSFETSVALTGVAATPAPTSAASTPCSQGDPYYEEGSLTGGIQTIPFPACNSYTTTGTMPANGADGDGLEIGVSAASQFGDSTTPANGTPILSLLVSPGPDSVTFTDTTQSLSISIASPKLSGSYTMELRENNSIIETITQIQAGGGAIAFNVHPLNGSFDVANYVAILYRN